MKRRALRWVGALVLLVALVLVGFGVWATVIPAPMQEAVAALESDAQVRVAIEPWLVFEPVEAAPVVGLVLYPGGRVDPRAYAPAARAIAEEGYLVVIVPVPLNLAVLAPDRAADVIAAYPEVATWVVGGHSLGGSMAASYADKHPQQVSGLVLWASYPAGSNDLSDQDLAVASIYGTRDRSATPEEVLAARWLLPPSTVWVAIDGGNHAQFGWYGPQPGDNSAMISREAQEAQIVEATLALLQRAGQ